MRMYSTRGTQATQNPGIQGVNQCIDITTFRFDWAKAQQYNCLKYYKQEVCNWWSSLAFDASRVVTIKLKVMWKNCEFFVGAPLKENLQCWRLPLQIIVYLCFCPFVNQSFCECRFGSLSTFESRFGSLCVGILIIVLRHCSSDIVECSADKLMRSATASRAQKRTQTGASPNAYFICFIFPYIIWDLVCSNTWSTQRILKNNQRTERTRKVQIQSSHPVVSNSFSTCFHARTICL